MYLNTCHFLIGEKKQPHRQWLKAKQGAKKEVDLQGTDRRRHAHTYYTVHGTPANCIHRRVHS